MTKPVTVAVAAVRESNFAATRLWRSTSSAATANSQTRNGIGSYRSCWMEAFVSRRSQLPRVANSVYRKKLTMCSSDNHIAERLQTATLELALVRAQFKHWENMPREVEVQRSDEYISVRDRCLRTPYREQTIRNLMSAGDLKEAPRSTPASRTRLRIMKAWDQPPGCVDRPPEESRLDCDAARSVRTDASTEG